MSLDRTGACACGTVRFIAHGGGPEFGACHCETCRRWAGGPNLAMSVDGVTVTAGEDDIAVWASSAWAERASCATCGGKLWYRLTGGGPGTGYILAVAALDDLSGLTLGAEIFTESKPAAYGFFEGSGKRMTGAEAMASFAAAPD